MKMINIYEIINTEKFKYKEDALKVLLEMKKVYYSEDEIIMNFKNITFILTSAMNQSLGFFIQKYGKEKVSKKVKITNIENRDLKYPIELSIKWMNDKFYEDIDKKTVLLYNIFNKYELIRNDSNSLKEKIEEIYESYEMFLLDFNKISKIEEGFLTNIFNELFDKYERNKLNEGIQVTNIENEDLYKMVSEVLGNY